MSSAAIVSELSIRAADVVKGLRSARIFQCFAPILHALAQLHDIDKISSNASSPTLPLPI